MTEYVKINEMSTSERLRTMEALWDALRRDEGDVPSPSRHGDVLWRRKHRAEQGEEKFLTLEQPRARFRGSKG